MITQLRVKNFKGWGEAPWHPGISLAPVTLILGTNSSGKTSLLQTLLLLKQTFASPDRQLDLNLGGQDHDLIDAGTYSDVIHGHDDKRDLAIGFSTKDGLGYEVHCGLAAGAPVTKQLILTCDGNRFSVTRQARGGYLLEAPGYTQYRRSDGEHLDAKRAFAPERSLAFSPDAVAELGAAGGMVQDVSLKVGRQISGLAYLGPLRQPPERTYLWSRQALGALGNEGEFAVAALLASANSLKKTKENEESGRGWLVERVSTWLNRLGIADSLEMVRQGRSRFFEVIVKTGGQRANVMDVGFGVSQILPFVVLAHFVPRGTTIIAEQPEIHLHPRVQAELANLMVEVSKERDVQFLVETHSEHLFRRMQTLAAEGRITPTDCQLYFVEAEKGKSKLVNLEMDEYGRVRNWPDKFFGDTVGETERQIRKMLERLQGGKPAHA